MSETTQQSDAKPDGWTWSFRDIVAKAMASVRPNRTTESPRWVAVCDTFGVGSTTSKEMCRFFGMDPYEKVSGVKCHNCEDEE